MIKIIAKKPQNFDSGLLTHLSEERSEKLFNLKEIFKNSHFLCMLLVV